MIEGFKVTIGVLVAIVAFPLVLAIIAIALAYTAKMLDCLYDFFARGKK